MRRRTLALALLAMLVACADAQAASLTLRPSIAAPGARVTVEGAAWRPQTTVRLRRVGGAVLARGHVGADGRFATTFQVPRGLRLRTHPLRAFGNGPARAIDARLRVVAQPRDWAPREVALEDGVRAEISRTVAFPTAPVRIDAYGLHKGNVVSARLRDGEPATTRADARGRATLRLTVSDQRIETSTLALRLGRIHRSEPFYVVPPETTVPPLPPPTHGDPLLAAAGDIACSPGEPERATVCHQGETSDLLVSSAPDVVAPVGDLQYDHGGPDEWLSYDASWGRVKARSRPAIGNHEYLTPGAAAYFQYWGAAAGSPVRGYYSYDVGSWHVVVLNSNCGFVGCGANGAQERWLRADLAAHPNACTLAYWHHPRQSSAQRVRENTSVDDLWRALVEGGADVAITGHVHNYERLAPLDADGQVDRRNGMRSFVVGTGGRNHQGLATLKPYSERSSIDAFGVLFLSLGTNGYGWTFQPEVGGSFVDTGSAVCH